MAKNTGTEDVLKWVSEQPELLERLRRFQEMEEDSDLEAGCFDALELELLEMAKAIGAGQLERCLGSKERAALEQARSQDGGRIGSKKKLKFKSLLGEIEVLEQVLRRGSKMFRPLADLLGVSSGGVTRSLQRVVVDFGAESSFAHASARLKLHHQVVLCASTVRKITLTHAQAIAKLQTPAGGVSLLPAQGADCIVSGIDGTMLPIVQTQPSQPGGGRKNRQCHWKETRLAAARAQGETTIHYAVSAGSVEAAGYSWAQAVAQAGWGLNSKLHVVCDGAAWIAFQCQSALGRDAHFLLDFYHVCEYLAAAAPPVGDHPRWLNVQKNRLKTNRVDRVIAELTSRIEAAHLPDEQAPVRAAKRYLENHLDALDYQGALKNDLPIGSGMIEASHRHVLQKRLKISGAWWTQANALSMAHLRVSRANQLDHLYWESSPLAA